MSGNGEFVWDKQKWTPLTEMAEGFDEFRPPVSDKLAGQKITLACQMVGEDESPLTLRQHFEDSGRVTWSVHRGDEVVDSGTSDYEAFEIADDLCYVHYLRQGMPAPVAVSYALDLANGAVTGAFGLLGVEPDPHLARQEWFQGLVEGSGSGENPHHHSSELVGRRVRYRYSSDDVYDHIYLTDNLFTWVCMGGAEQGEGDTERCVHWKIREGVYLFSWLEKLLGVEGMVLVNFEQLRSVGIQFALDQFSGELVNLTMGAYAKPLTITPAVGEE
ncbi:MAG: MoaF C-terminal domain-containing protein [Haloechinothrix sp.]